MVKVSDWDASDYLESREDMIAYLDAAAESGDPAVFQAALGDIARSRGMSAVAREAGVGRESLYKSLAMTGNPSFETISKVLAALGAHIRIEGNDVPAA